VTWRINEVPRSEFLAAARMKRSAIRDPGLDETVSDFPALHGVRHQPAARTFEKAEAILLKRFSLMLAVQSCLQKYFCSRLTQIKSISPPSRPKQGAYRDRHGRGAGCDGRGSVRRAHGARTNGAVPPSLKLRRTGTRPVEGFGVDGSRTAKSCGPDAPTLVSSFAEQSAQRRWQKSPVTGESTK
jgi:hypothetical protein